jgi:hypothetical protein
VLHKRNAEGTYSWVEGYTYEVVEDLVADDSRHFEALLAGDRVDNHVAMDADEVFRVEDAVLVLHRSEAVSELLEAVSRLSNCTARTGRVVGAAWLGGAWGSRRAAGRKKWSSTWPAVSMISVAKSWFLYRIILLNVFSMVG